jgi:hypothetical protein
VTHTGVIDVSLQVTDIHDGEDPNGRVQNAKPGAVYIPVSQSVDLVYTSQVAKSFENGALRVWIEKGWLTAEFIFGGEFGDAVADAGTVEVQDEGVQIEDRTHTLNFIGGNVTASNPSPGVVNVTVLGSGGAIVVEDEGVVVDAVTTLLNFVGPNVSATSGGAGQIDVAMAALEVKEEGGSVKADTLSMNFLGSQVTASDGGGNEVDVAVAVDIGNLGSGTLAELNTAITDATLDDVGDPRTPTAHTSTHENGGGDEINVGGLSGELADAQKVTVSDEGTPVGTRPEINFIGTGVTAADDAGNGRINVTLSTPAPKIVEITGTSYTVLADDEVVLVNQSTDAPVTITLPAGASHNTGLVTIKDKRGTASTYNISIAADGAETVDGLNPFPIDLDYAARQLVFFGTEWSIV